MDVLQRLAIVDSENVGDLVLPTSQGTLLVGVRLGVDSLDNAPGLGKRDLFGNELVHLGAESVIVQVGQAQNLTRLGNLTVHRLAVTNLERLLRTTDCGSNSIRAAKTKRDDGDRQVGRSVVRRVDAKVALVLVVTVAVRQGQAVVETHETKNARPVGNGTGGCPVATMQHVVAKGKKLFVGENVVTAAHDAKGVGKTVEGVVAHRLKHGTVETTLRDQRLKTEIPVVKVTSGQHLGSRSALRNTISDGVPLGLTLGKRKGRADTVGLGVRVEAHGMILSRWGRDGPSNKNKTTPMRGRCQLQNEHWRDRKYCRPRPRMTGDFIVRIIITIKFVVAPGRKEKAICFFANGQSFILRSTQTK